MYELSIVHPDDRERVATHLRRFASRPGPDAVSALEPILVRRRRKGGEWAKLELVGVSDVRPPGAARAGTGARR